MTWTYEVNGAKATITGASPLPSALVFPNNLGGFTEMIIKDYLFQTRSVLKSVRISDGVAVIGRYAFSKCPNLTSVNTGNGVKNIGEHAFIECRNLKSVTIGNSVTNIGVWAFGYCTNLVSVEIGDGLRSVENHGFGSCYRLRYLAFTDSLESIAAGTGGALTTGGDLNAVAVPKSWQGTDKLDGTGVRIYTKIYYGTQKVTFNPTGGTCEMATHRVGIGATYKEFGGLPEATKPGSRLVGWFTDPGKGTQVTEDSTVPDTATRTLYARWKPTQTETFDPNGGTCPTETKIVDRGQATDTYGWVPVASREYFAFLGWFSEKEGGEPVEFDTMVSSEAARTLYAHWEAPSPVWRFYSPTYKGHFYTIDETEKDGLIANNPNWTFEGEAYRAFTVRRPGTVALHRFYSANYRGHFYTVDEAEKDDIIATNQKNWTYEDVAYYVFPMNNPDRLPVYRFWSGRYRHHFYTMDAAEMDGVRDGNPNWTFEDVAFWAIPTEETIGRIENGTSLSAELVNWGTTLSWNLPHGNVVAGSVEVFFNGESGMKMLADDQTGRLVQCSNLAAEGLVKYSTGRISVTFASHPGFGKKVFVKYKYVKSLSTAPLSAPTMTARPLAAVAYGNGGASDEVSSNGRVAEVVPPWTLAAVPGAAVIAVPGETDFGGVVVETRAAVPDADELAAPETGDASETLALRLSPPAGTWNALLWSSTDSVVADETAEGAFEFDLPASGVWHWLRVRAAEDEDAADAYSLWFRAE